MWTESELATALGSLNSGNVAIELARSGVGVLIEKLDNGQAAVTLEDAFANRTQPAFFVSISAGNIASSATKISNEISKFVL